MWNPSIKSLFLLACLFTLADCFKPLTIDDAAYSYYAHQAAVHPLDPYGFAVMWWDRPYVANEVLAPPLLPGWWALGIRLFGEQPVLWKLWLLPFALTFVGALYALFHRFCHGLEMPLTWMTVLSPAFLPGFNLMLDVPALALALASLALFLHACDRDSFALTALAGLVAGLAMETKYTAFLAPATMLLYAVLAGKWRLWPVAAVLAVQLFASWELFVALVYGESHFLFALRESGHPLLEKLRLWFPLVCLLGSVAPTVGLLGLAGLTRRAWPVGLASLVVVAGYVVVMCSGAALEFRSIPSFRTPGKYLTVPPEHAVFLMLGLLAVGIGAAVLWRLCVGERDALPQSGRWDSDRDRWFLILWLGLEVAGYFALTSFPAVRRVLGVVVVATLLAGMLSAQTCSEIGRRQLIHCIVAGTILLGFGFAALDWWEAWTEKTLAESAATTARAHGTGKIWFVGHWGFQHYAERSGMQALVPQYYGGNTYVPLPPPSQVRKGDWLVVPDLRVDQQAINWDEEKLEPMFELAVSDPVPVQTVMCYYCGLTAVEHQGEPTRLLVKIYRATGDFIPVRPDNRK